MGVSLKTQKTTKNLLLLFTFLFAIILFSQQTLAACCLIQGQGCQSVTQELCEDLNGVYNQSVDCTQIEQCTLEGICCTEQDPTKMTKIQCAEAVFLPGVSDPSVCSDLAMVVKGTTTFNNSQPARTNIEISVQETGGLRYIKSVQSQQTGNYSTNLIAGQVYSFKATSIQNSSCTITREVNLPENAEDPTIINLQLPCTNESGQQQPPACVQQWTWDWEFPDKQCGRRFNIVQTNPECTSGTPPKPADYLPCLQDPVLTCIVDGILNTTAGEQCDPLLGLGALSCTSFTNPATGTNFIGGALACTDGCKINTDGCYSCPSDISECTNSNLCSCTTCANAEICQQQCTETDKIINAEAKAFPNETQKLIKVSWETPDYCDSSTITVRRCKGDSNNKCTSSQAIIANLPGNAISYLDSFSITDKGKYCYNVSANIVAGTSQFTISSSGLVCAELANTTCVGKPWDGSYFCNGQTELGYCNEEGQYTGHQSCQGCYGPGGDPTQPIYECQLPQICEMCNGPFGLFVSDYALFSTNYDFCDDALSDFACYTDDYSQNRTIKGDTKSCTEVKSCYDYLTQDSCSGSSNNPCDIVAAENCKWVNFTSVNELGLGVCIPQDVEEQDCTKCGQNGVLGNYCPQEICSLFGDQGKCHYNEKTSQYATDNSTCMNVEYVSCETYDNEAQCIGGSKTNFSANIIYGQDGRTGNNHVVNKNSNDTYGLGRCVWTGISCIKDSDLSSKKPTPDLISDCGRASSQKGKDINCLLDFTAPNTTLFILDQPFVNNSIYSKTQLSNLIAIANENIDKDKTYFSMIQGFEEVQGASPYYDFIYPTKTRTQLIDEINDLTRGKYALYYYSEDENKNLEEVKTIYFELAQDLSSVTLTYTNISRYDLQSDQYLTNITLYVNYNKPLTCTLNLTLTNNLAQKFTGDATKTTPDLIWQYNNLVDGTYSAKAVCVDQYLQRKEITKQINIEADTTIKNPRPRGTTYRPGNIQISIETTDTATCYYTNSPTYVPPPDPTAPPVTGIWTRFSSTGGNTHSSSVNINVEGLHFFYTGCAFQNPSRTFVGNYGDMAYFAVDNSSPKLKLIDQNTGQEYNNSASAETVSLKLICDDDHPLLSGIYPTNYAFGCTKVNYSLVLMHPNNTVLTASNFQIVESGIVKEFKAPLVNAKTYLNVTLKDLGNNTKTNQSVFLNLRNLTFIPPNVTICDPTNSSLCT